MSTVVLSLIIGIILYFVAVRAHTDWLFLSRIRRRAHGTVMDHRRLTDDGSDKFFAIIRFEADDGQTIEITDFWGSRSRWPAAGSSIQVEYPVGLPRKARIPRPWMPFLAYGLSVALLAILVCFLAFPDGLP